MSASPTSWARASPRPNRRSAPVLREAAKRGLIYLDDGSSPRSLAGQIAGANNLPFAKADVVHRRGADRSRRSTRALARLETHRARARRRGRRRRRAAGRDRAHRQMGEGGRRAAASCWCRSPRWRTRPSRADGAAHAAASDALDAIGRLFFVIRPLSSVARSCEPMPRFEDLPYRPCVGTCVLNRDGLVLHRPPHRRARARRRDPCLADAAGRHRSGRGSVARRRCASSTRRPTSARSSSSARSRTGSATTFRARSSARPGRASIAARSRNGSRCASPATTARSTSRIRPAATSRNSSSGAGSRCENLPDLVVPFKRKVYERVVKEFAKFAKPVK